MFLILIDKYKSKSGFVSVDVGTLLNHLNFFYALDKTGKREKRIKLGRTMMDDIGVDHLGSMLCCDRGLLPL